MIPVTITPQHSVAEILTRWPAAASIFLQHRMGCVGCQLNAFDTLADTARIYGISLPDFLLELHHITQPNESLADKLIP